MNRPPLVLVHASVFVTLVTLVSACAPDHLGPDQPIARAARQAPARSDLRIAVVGAGASGLTAAYTLAELGYRNVTVFEKEDRVGGKVNSFKLGSVSAELGAVFTSPDYEVVLGLADRLGIPYASYSSPRYVLDESRTRRTFQEFLLRRYSVAEIGQAIRNYAIAVQRFAQVQQEDGFAGLPAELAMTFDKFAAKHGFVPVAELAKSLMVGFGYGYYETVPAAYMMKLLPWLVKVGPGGLESPPYFVFPGGFQSLWQAVAAQLDVRLRSRVVRVDRSDLGGPVHLTIEGVGRREFDAVILSTPLDAVPRLMTVSRAERALFSQIETSRYFVTLFVALHLQQAETVFVHDHARPEKINHASVWGNPGGDLPVFIAYQLADRNISPHHLIGTLALDILDLGHGAFIAPLVQKEWDYFPRVGPKAFEAGFHQGVAALQGNGGVYYVGSALSFETVEHTARFARSLVRSHFPAVN